MKGEGMGLLRGHSTLRGATLLANRIVHLFPERCGFSTHGRFGDAAGREVVEDR